MKYLILILSHPLAPGGSRDPKIITAKKLHADKTILSEMKNLVGDLP